MFNKGDYAHWRGYGLVKIHGKEEYHDALAGKQIRYKVKTGVSGSGFNFGIKTAYDHELRPVSISDAKQYIKRMKESRNKNNIHSDRIHFPL